MRLPSSLELRGILLVLLVAGTVGLAGWWGHLLLARRQETQFVRSSEALLAVALSSHLDRQPGAGEWVQRLSKLGMSVRWAGVFNAQREGLEFRRLTNLRREEILDQIPFGQQTPTCAPVVVNGRPSKQFQLLTIPQSDGGVLATIIDLGTAAPTGSGGLALCIALALAGLLGGLLYYQLAIQKPLSALSGWVTQASRGLTAAALADNAPQELRDLAQSIEQVQREMQHWRAEAGDLRQSLDARVEAKTKTMSRALHESTRQADTDPLSKLLNRRAMIRDLPGLVELVYTRGSELTALMIDIDHFKNLNDTLGHQTGDELVMFVGELVRATIRKRTDLAVRYGGDEFVLLLPDTNTLEAGILAQRLRELFTQRVKALTGVDPRPSLSIGVASLRQHRAGSWERLLAMADTAMYHAKRHHLGVATAREVDPTASASAAQPNRRGLTSRRSST
ncbi:MAG: GGDEF domain-containing protein [Phycisphaerae bacterium]